MWSKRPVEDFILAWRPDCDVQVPVPSVVPYKKNSKKNSSKKQPLSPSYTALEKYEK